MTPEEKLNELMMDRLDERLDRIESKVDKLQPLLDEYTAYNLFKAKVGYGLKVSSMLLGLLLGGYTLKERIVQRDVPTHKER